MNLFGIGTSEFIIIFIIALILLGPERLPQYVNKLGQKIREWRVMSQVFMVEWKAELAALEEARQSLAEARSALLEARGTISNEVKEVSQTVATEMNQVQRDISAQLSDAEKVVAAETAQVRDTIDKVKHGKLELEAGESSSAATVGDTETAPAADAAAAADAEGGDVSDGVSDDVISDGVISDGVISDVMPLDEDVEFVENSIAPPLTAKPSPISNSGEIDAAGVQTVNTVASAVARKIATEVATQVAHKVAKNMTSNMAEEVAALVLAKLAESGVVDLEIARGELETLEPVSKQSESAKLPEVVHE